MSEHRATIAWKRTSADFKYDTYNRDHMWHIDGGIDVPASAAPEYRGTMDRVDPERALVASLSACHMLTFLAIAARKRLNVDAYEDEASGVMTKNDKGKLFVSHVTLRPKITWSGEAPAPEEIEAMHHKAHEECFIANSVLTEIAVEPR
jgi:organic hydroperoxide reductase OsmC/OhrA